MSREIPEWIGKTDDDPVPPRVRLRVFDRFKGICCECETKIIARRWICDHRQALINGGQNREANLGPIHADCDKTKTAADVAEKSKNARVRSKHLGIKKRKGRPFPGARDSGIKMKVGGGWVRR
jgi:5-methylcytosine-specific restriction protein A